MRLDQSEREGIVAGRHRRVSREHRRPADVLQGGFERLALFDLIANPLEHHERRVAFVQMPHRRGRAERFQRAHAADAEDDLLLDARLPISAVQPRGELTIPWSVFLQIGVEQVQRHAAETHAPD
jgi:hypothetical protein